MAVNYKEDLVGVFGHGVVSTPDALMQNALARKSARTGLIS